MKCIIETCNNMTYARRPGVSFHQFPPGVAKRKVWLRALGRPDMNVAKSTLICSEHFLETDLVRFVSRNVLVDDAVPMLKITPEQTKKESLRQKRSPAQHSVESDEESPKAVTSSPNFNEITAEQDRVAEKECTENSSSDIVYLKIERLIDDDELDSDTD